MIWPFHSSNASCWSSMCQLNVGAWNMSCPVAIVLQIDYNKGLEMTGVLKGIEI